MSFTLDTKAYQKYGDDLGRARARLKFATALFLTELAFKGREAALEELAMSLVIRDKNFTKRHVAVYPARRGQPVTSQVSRMGSKGGPRFTGWREQQSGGTKDRAAFPRARTGGTIKGKLAGRYRLKPGNTFPTDRSAAITNAKSPGHRAFIFLRMMSRLPKKPFVLLDHPILEPGIWTLTGRHGKGRWPRPQMLQLFGAKAAVSREPWMTDALAALHRRVNLEGLWYRVWKQASVTKKK